MYIYSQVDFFYLRLWKHDHRSSLYFTYGIYVCMYTCIHTCVGVHASFLCSYRALSCSPRTGTAPTDVVGTCLGEWHRIGHTVCEFSAIPSRRIKPQTWRKARWCGFARGWYFGLCACVSLFFFFFFSSFSFFSLSLSPPTRPPLGL